jgi:hypothetical protein
MLEQVVTAAEFPHGLRCARCCRLFAAGERYVLVPEAMSGSVPVEELVCPDCGERP